jgi:hypothetical protein
LFSRSLIFSGLSKKYSLLGLFLICLITGIPAQSRIILKAKSCEIVWKRENLFVIEIHVTNNLDTGILVPEFPNVVKKGYAAVTEIGVKIKSKHGHESGHCPTSIHDLGMLPKMIMIKPGETKIIKANLLGDCFDKKGYYRVVFYLGIPRKKNKYKQYSSNRIEINVK